MHYPLAVFLSVRFLNVMTKFLGAKTQNNFPVICLMQGLLLKAEFLKCRNLMIMLILIPFFHLNFERNLHNLAVIECFLQCDIKDIYCKSLIF